MQPWLLMCHTCKGVREGGEWPLQRRMRQGQTTGLMEAEQGGRLTQLGELGSCGRGQGVGTALLPRD